MSVLWEKDFSYTEREPERPGALKTGFINLTVF